MPIPDITNLTATELRELIEAASDAFLTAQQAESNQRDAQRAAVRAAIPALEALPQDALTATVLNLARITVGEA